MVPVPGNIRFTADRPLSWELGVLGSGLVVTVPGCFEHDVSVPRALWWLFSPRDPTYQRAARLHDWLLAGGWRAWDCAAVFDGALRADAVSRSRRHLMVAAVLMSTLNSQRRSSVD